MKPEQPDNGASLIIDALLMRMSELDRFSDDDTFIKNHELLPFDVVIDDKGKFGFVHSVINYRSWVDGKQVFRAFVSGRAESYYADNTSILRTIYETEGAMARTALLTRVGGAND